MDFRISRVDSKGMDECNHILTPVQPVYVDEQKDIKEDRRLSNWKKWMRIRKEQHSILYQSLQRRQEDLVMNSAEKYEFRTLNETRECLEYAKQIVPPEPCGIDYWISSQATLKAKQLNKGMYIDGSRPCHNMTYVGVPKAIMKEKGLPYEPTLVLTGKFINSPALYKARKELEHELSVVEQERPHFKNLVIIGKSAIPKTPPKKIPRKSEASKNVYVTEVVDEISPYANSPAIMLKIDEIVLGENVIPELETSKQNSWHFIFETRLNCLQMCHLRLQNLSDINLTISWNRYDIGGNQIITTPQIYKSCFYFDKNEIVLFSGQTILFPFWFAAPECGCFQETWELITRPCVTGSDEHILVFLFGVASDYITLKVLKDIDQEIEKRAALKMAECLAKEMIENVDAPLPIPDPLYKEFFYEKDIFLIKNRLYFYDSVTVKALSDLYNSLIESSKVYDLEYECEDESLITPWDYDINTIRNLILNIPETKLRLQYYGEFTNFLGNLLKAKPKYERYTEKYTTAYSILCKFANTIDDDAINLKNIYNLNVRSESNEECEYYEMSSEITTNSSFEVVSESQNFSLDTCEKLRFRSNESITDKQVREYKDALFLRVYSNFAVAVEEIAAAVESYNRTM